MGGSRGDHKRIGCGPGDTGHRNQGQLLSLSLPPASWAPHSGGMGLSGTFQVSLAVSADPGPGKWDKGQITLLVVASNGTRRGTLLGNSVKNLLEKQMFS